ncbi:MAG: hypothetical protein NTZ78_09320 [Candidatus Aureabacteria bacterium]|nr:hypothetical protein [Candidatus Auribacterota bacterium]
MRATLVVVANVMLMAGLCGTMIAGSIDSPGAPSAGSGMYTLSQIYDYMNSGIDVTPIPSFQEPAVAPGPTMKTTKQIYEDIKAKFAQCNATADVVMPGYTFFCTQPGSWGVQTGNYVTPTPTSTPTLTPTITPSPTPTITPTCPTGDPWYVQYGPCGEGKVVLIGSMYVAKWTNNEGTASNERKGWPAARQWATGLDWLGKDSGWRLPTDIEIASICEAKSSLGAYEAETRPYYWSDTQRDSASANWIEDFSRPVDCTVQSGNWVDTNRVRAVRNAM